MSKINIEPGQRKLIATVITMIIGIVADKYMGGLSDNLALLIGSALGLFVGGNAMEYVAQIKGAVKVSLPPEQKEEVGGGHLPEPVITIPDTQKQLNQLDQICGQVFAKYDKQFLDLHAAIGRQNTSIKGMLDIVNNKQPVMRGEFDE